MDRVIRRYLSKEKSGFKYCYSRGVAFQADMESVIDYGDEYIGHYDRLKGKKRSLDINHARIRMVARHLPPGARVLDVGIGSGEFIELRNRGMGRITYGYDINLEAEKRLRQGWAWAKRNWDIFEGFCFWDTLEHVPSPHEYLDRIRPGKYAFLSMPIYGEDLDRIPQSKHFKPGEHLYYFSRKGLIDWMGKYGFEMKEENNEEKMLGRNRVLSFAFKKT